VTEAAPKVEALRERVKSKRDGRFESDYGPEQGDRGNTPRAARDLRVWCKVEGGPAKANRNRYRAADALKDNPTPESRASPLGGVDASVLDTL
jgi:hypothetical protein